MTKREKLIAEADADLERYLLPKEVDGALLGYAERGGKGRYVLPCYGYQAIKAILKSEGFSGINLYAKLREILDYNSRVDFPLMLTKYNKRELWKIVKEGKFTRWEGLDYAALGIGSIGYNTTGLVYSKPGCVEILNDTSSGLSSSESESDNIVYAIKKLEESLIPVDTGEHNPWYLTPIK